MILIREIQVKCEDNETGPGVAAHRREKETATGEKVRERKEDRDK